MANAKLIDTKSFQTKAQYNEAVKLATSINKNHVEISKRQEQLDHDKAKLSDISKAIFTGDLNGAIPALYGNHEYHVPDDIVSVNFKLSVAPISEINKKPADSFLKSRFGEEAYKKCFTEKKGYKSTADAVKQLEQAKSHPELFRVSLRPDLEPEDLRKILEAVPDKVVVQVSNPEQYAKAYPGDVETETKVAIKGGFLEKVAKLDENIRKKVAKVLKAIIAPNVYTAILCGNAAKKK